MPLQRWLYVSKSSFFICLGYAWKVSLKCLTWVLMLHLIPKFSVWENEHNSMSVNVHRKMTSLLYTIVWWTNDKKSTKWLQSWDKWKQENLPLGTLTPPWSLVPQGAWHLPGPASTSSVDCIFLLLLMTQSTYELIWVTDLLPKATSSHKQQACVCCTFSNE